MSWRTLDRVSSPQSDSVPTLASYELLALSFLCCSSACDVCREFHEAHGRCELSSSDLGRCTGWFLPRAGKAALFCCLGLFLTAEIGILRSDDLVAEHEEEVQPFHRSEQWFPEEDPSLSRDAKPRNTKQQP